jgi:quercetin dioxygenase-like cupin family protein
MLNKIARYPVICAALLAANLAGAAYAADGLPTQTLPNGVRRNELQKTTVPGGKYVVIMNQLDMDAGAKVAMHTHPGVETGYVISGMLTLSVKGEGDRTLGPGESYLIPSGRPHSAVSGGPDAFKGIVTYIVEADKPVSTPAP